MELLRKVLEDKEKEIADTKNQLRQVKEEVVCEYWDSDAFLSELGQSFAEGFDDALCQVKSSYLDLDVSHVSIETQAQSTAQPVLSESTEDLFADDALADNAIVDRKGDRDAATKVNRKLLRRVPVNPWMWRRTMPQLSRVDFIFNLCKDFGEQLILILTIALCI